VSGDAYGTARSLDVLQMLSVWTPARNKNIGAKTTIDHVTPLPRVTWSICFSPYERAAAPSGHSEGLSMQVSAIQP
jgi:hypothetical protein